MDIKVGDVVYLRTYEDLCSDPDVVVKENGSIFIYYVGYKNGGIPISFRHLLGQRCSIIEAVGDYVIFSGAPMRWWMYEKLFVRDDPYRCIDIPEAESDNEISFLLE